MLRKIRSLGMKAGLAINPDVPVEDVFPYIKDADYILVMSVFAGFGGQKFIPETMDKVRFIRREIEERHLDTLLEVDGGVNADNARYLFAAGADVLVAGSAVFRAPDPVAAIRQMMQ